MPPLHLYEWKIVVLWLDMRKTSTKLKFSVTDCELKTFLFTKLLYFLNHVHRNVFILYLHTENF